MNKSPTTGSIKIFLDGADRSTILEMAPNPLVQGFTTNPSLMKKAGVKDYGAYCRELLPQLQGKPISYEVFADDFPEMKRQAHEIASWDKNHQIYVKIPIVNSRGESCLPLIRELSHSGIQLNVTALYTLDQIWGTCQALRGGAPSIASVFAGRIADTGRDPLPLMHAAAAMCAASDSKIELLWASTREAYNIVQAELTGCRIITAPVDMIRKVAHFGKDLQEVTLDTVKTFKKDADSAGFAL